MRKPWFFGIKPMKLNGKETPDEQDYELLDKRIQYSNINSPAFIFKAHI